MFLHEDIKCVIQKLQKKTEHKGKEKENNSLL